MAAFRHARTLNFLDLSMGKAKTDTNQRPAGEGWDLHVDKDYNPKPRPRPPPVIQLFNVGEYVRHLTDWTSCEVVEVQRLNDRWVYKLKKRSGQRELYAGGSWQDEKDIFVG